MTRPNFSVSLPGYARNVRDGGYDTGWALKANCRTASETVSGTSRRKPKGWIPPTGYSLDRVEIERAYGHAESWVTKFNWSVWDGYVGNGLFNSINHFDNAMSTYTANDPLSSSAALVAARNRLKGQTVNLGVAFGERKATSRQLGDAARRMAQSVRELRRGNFRNAARALGIIGDVGRPRGSNWTNHWLQLQYGWKPLISDVYGSVAALSKRPPGDWRVTSTAQRKDVFTSVVNGGGADLYSCKAVRNRGVFVRIDAIPQNDLSMSLSSVGVTNPLEVAWELVPYSFVVDWALPVGKWLSSLDALLGYGPAWTSTTYWNETFWEDTGRSQWNSPTNFIKNNWLGTKRVLRVNRVASSGVPLPAFPSIKDPRSLGHMANGLSLLAQAFGR